MPNKVSEDRQETNSKRYLNLFGHHTCGNHHLVVNKGPNGFLYHMLIWNFELNYYRHTETFALSHRASIRMNMVLISFTISCLKQLLGDLLGETERGVLVYT